MIQQHRLQTLLQYIIQYITGIQNHNTEISKPNPILRLHSFIFFHMFLSFFSPSSLFSRKRKTLPFFNSPFFSSRGLKPCSLFLWDSFFGDCWVTTCENELGAFLDFRTTPAHSKLVLVALLPDLVPFLATWRHGAAQPARNPKTKTHSSVKKLQTLWAKISIRRKIRNQLVLQFGSKFPFRGAPAGR